MTSPLLILDASALLAVMLQEPGSDMVLSQLRSCSMSAVNYSEVLTRLIREGESPEEAVADVAAFDLPIIYWDQETAAANADLSALAKTHGLSLGDRACLATARRLNRGVLTAERTWSKLPKLGIDIQVIR